MKKFIKVQSFSIIFITAIFYIAGSFYNASFDISDWIIKSREIITVLWCVLVFISAVGSIYAAALSED